MALATSLSAYLNAWLLLRGLLKAEVYRPEAGWGHLLGVTAAGCAALAGVVLLGGPALDEWLAATVWERIVDLVMWIGVGGAAPTSASSLLSV